MSRFLLWSAVLLCAALLWACDAPAPSPADAGGGGSSDTSLSGGADAATADAQSDTTSGDAAPADVGTASDGAPLDAAALDAPGSDAGPGDTTAPDSAPSDVTASDAGPAPDALPDTAADIAPPAPVQCTGVTPSFPDFSKACAADDDCFVAYHQINCCGTLIAWGLSTAGKAAFDAAESQCEQQYPACGCAQMPTAAEDGYTSMDGTGIEAACVNSECTAAVAGAKPVCTEFGFSSPKVLKFCKVDADCGLVTTLTDCCGSQQVIGIAASSLATWQAAQQACPPQVVCDCMSKPTIAEDGQPTDGAKVLIQCKLGMCTSGVVSGP